MKKVYWLSMLVAVASIWFLSQAIGDAQDPAGTMTGKVFEIVLALVVATAGILLNRFAKAYLQQPKNIDLAILTKVKTEKK